MWKPASSPRPVPSSRPAAVPDRAGRPLLAAGLAVAALLAGAAPAAPQFPPGPDGRPTPVRQSSLGAGTAGDPVPVTLRDASRDDRWLGLGPRDVRWAPDGSRVYFRWHPDPAPGQDPDADPWFAVDRDGGAVERVPRAGWDRIPADDLVWSPDGLRAAWSGEDALFLYDARADGGDRIRAVLAGLGTPRRPAFTRDGAGLHFMLGEDLHRWDLRTGTARRLTRRHTTAPAPGEPARWLADEQLRVFDHVRRVEEERRQAGARERLRTDAPQPLPVRGDERIEDVRLSPDGRFVTFRARTPPSDPAATAYMAYVTASGRSEAERARPRVGSPGDAWRLGIVPFDPAVDPDSVEVTWVAPPGADGRPATPFGPAWSVEGDRAVVTFVGEDGRDQWIAELDVETGETTVLAHDRDDAWLGGPPIQPNYFQPGLVEWLPGGRLAFASERTGWSHLWLVEPDGSVRPLTTGEWEVRNARLSRDRSTWLLQASREHPAEDHLYLMPAGGGEMVRLTEAPGRHEGLFSPDGSRLAVLSGDNTHLPDLWLRDAAQGDGGERVTVSGTDAFRQRRLVEPEIVSFAHPDGEPVWAALYRPAEPNAERAAVIHVHGGGYRQFAHRGWSVYGWAQHLGFIHWLLEQGYTVLDFDYRGSAGFGRDYRTDIHRSMGQKDVDGAAAAVEWLAREEGVDRGRVGIYGVSYGGFMTLMSLFRYPGTFAAGIARAAVSDWSDYNDTWTRRILGVPADDPEAYRTSSPIYWAEGLEDPLLITHGLVDGNVHFQDAAQIVQRLIELEKDFEVMVYPVEPHTIQTEASRWDYVRRAAAFFERHLRGR